MSPSPRIREVYGDGDELEEEEEDDDVLADFAFERGTGIVGGDHLARVASAENGSPDAKAAAGPSSSFGDDPGVAATMAVARMMSATGAKSLPQGLVRLMSPYQAHYDELTGLANRSLFTTCLEAAVETAAAEPAASFAVLFVDLDRFKAVNDTLGHQAGDLLLQQVARRLEQTVGDVGLVGRLGGDEFQILLPGIDQRERLSALATDIIATLS